MKIVKIDNHAYFVRHWFRWSLWCHVDLLAEWMRVPLPRLKGKKK